MKALLTRLLESLVYLAPLSGGYVLPDRTRR